MLPDAEQRNMPAPPGFSDSQAGENEASGDFENTENFEYETEDQTASPSADSSDTRTDTAKEKTAPEPRGALTQDSSDNQTKQAEATSPPAFKPAATRVDALKQYALIINKNLFSPKRKKWVSPPAGGKRGAGTQAAKKVLDKLVLFGTIISPQGRYAVLRTKKTKTARRARKSRKSKQAAESFQPYTLGDYIAGYRIKEIESKKVTFVDESTSQEYTVFINAAQKLRRVEKTARKRARPKPVLRPKRRRRTPKRRLPRKPRTIPAPRAGKWRR